MISIDPIKIAIASGKGGTGKTLVATSLFYALQRERIEATLVDCDAEEPNVMSFFQGQLEKSAEVMQRVPVIDENKCTYCGKCHEYCNYKAIFILPPMKVIKVMEDLCHGCGACTVACEYGAIVEKDVSLGQVNQYAVSENSKIIESRMECGCLFACEGDKGGHKRKQQPQGRYHGFSPWHFVSLYPNRCPCRFCYPCYRAYALWA